MSPRRQPRGRRRQGGFTLIEILLALAIVAFVTATLVGTFSQTSRTKRQMEAAQERIHVARVALLRMTREVEMAFISDAEDQFNPDRRTMFVGTPSSSDELRFSWFGKQRLRADGAEADSSVVMYYLAPDPDDRGLMNLMRRETYRLEKGDPKTLPGEAYVLCPNVTRVKFNYYDVRKKEWREDWNTLSADGQPFLPTHVRIWLSLVDERGQEVTYFSSARLMMTEKVGYRPVKS
jgi:general secretion pathway protein J